MGSRNIVDIDLTKFVHRKKKKYPWKLGKIQEVSDESK
jgi:hypothetical protein